MAANKVALIVAGGSGSRMGADIPKQFLLLHGLPILMHTLNVFANVPSIEEIILVLPESQIDHWTFLCSKHHFETKHKIVKGGDTRYQSVKNGLKEIRDHNSLVAIHDGVRPLITCDVIETCFDAAEKFGNAIPVLKPVESVRVQEGISSSIIDREKILLVQTPQVFKFSIINRGYETPYRPTFTDDASVAEFIGERIHLVEGNRENIKITTPLDLKIAEALIR
ncbi:MAG TPA: 2-C-methyl-D-erythritol 4-phosphate cytidylyltransferase [Bacteroidales bacterium]|nr:2-C-methyl-D-erythritol 4-phosphate cytidylyltransferase [Bacteroidales bacterium]